VPPFGRPDLLLFACPKRSRQEKGHPSRAPSGILPPGARSGSAGSRTAHPALRERAHVRVRAPAGLVLRPLAARQGAPLRGHRGRAGLAAPTVRQQDAPARGAADELRKRHGARFPCVAPSSAGSRRGKAWMFEAMDGRARPLRGYVSLSLEHAGRRVPSNAGHRHRAAMPARQSGRLSLYFSLARRAAQERGRTPKAARRAAGRMPAVQREVTRAGRRPDRKLLLRL
jgi:hypothetical protein